MNEARGPKRFIAGAVCPKCAQMDKIVLYRVSETEQVRECVRCGFKETLRDEVPGSVESGPDEPPTRVNQPRPGQAPLPHEEQVQVVEVLDPKKDGRGRRDH